MPPSHPPAARQPVHRPTTCPADGPGSVAPPRPAPGVAPVRAIGTRERRELRLLLRYRERGDEHAREELVRRLQPLVRSTVQPFTGRSVALEDLVQVANLGLAKALERFDVDRGHRLITFAIPTMQGEIKRHFRDSSWALRVPRSVKDLHSGVMRAAREHPAMTLREVAEAEGLEAGQVDDVIAADRAFHAFSLDVPASPDVDHVHVTHGADDPGYHHVDTRLTIDAVCASADLSADEHRIVELRFRRGLYQREIAVDLGCSQMQVSRLLSSIEERLRAAASVVRPA